MIQLACHLGDVPGTDLAARLHRVREMGFAGVEIDGQAADWQHVRPAVESAGLKAVCLLARAGWSGDPAQDAASVELLRQDVEAAAALGCCVVRMELGPAPRRGSAQSVAIEVARWIRPVADQAGSNQIALAITNRSSFAGTASMWGLMEQISHRAVGCCLDLMETVLAHDPPEVAVTTLNSRIQIARITCATLDASRVRPSPLGESRLPWQRFVRRLLGIGYDGWIVVHAPPSEQALDHLAEARLALAKELTPPGPPKTPTKKPSTVT